MSVNENKKMKIGIQVLAYNCQNTIEEVLNPWIKLKSEYDIKIWVASGQFRIYQELGYANENGPTLEVLYNLLENQKIDFIFTPDESNLLDDHETRNKSIDFFKKNDVDLMVVLDSDEFYKEDEVKTFFDYIQKNPEYTLYMTVFKNLIKDGTEYIEFERYTAARIKNFGGISHFYFDCHWSFKGENGENVEYRWTPTTTIPKELVHPIHDTWTNKRRGSGHHHIISKIEYQKRYYSHEPGWKWNEEKQSIEINEIVFETLPEIKKLSN